MDLDNTEVTDVVEDQVDDAANQLLGDQDVDSQDVDSQDAPQQNDVVQQLLSTVTELKDEIHRLKSDNGRFRKTLFGDNRQSQPSQEQSASYGNQSVFNQQPSVQEPEADPFVELYGGDNGAPLSKAVNSYVSKAIERALGPHMGVLGQLNQALSANSQANANRKILESSFQGVTFNDVEPVLRNAGATDEDIAMARNGLVPVEQIAPFYREAFINKIKPSGNPAQKIASKLEAANKGSRPVIVDGNKQSGGQIDVLKQLEGKTEAEISEMIYKNHALADAIEQQSKKRKLA